MFNKIQKLLKGDFPSGGDGAEKALSAQLQTLKRHMNAPDAAAMKAMANLFVSSVYQDNKGQNPQDFHLLLRTGEKVAAVLPEKGDDVAALDFLAAAYNSHDGRAPEFELNPDPSDPKDNSPCKVYKLPGWGFGFTLRVRHYDGASPGAFVTEILTPVRKQPAGGKGVRSLTVQPL